MKVRLPVQSQPLSVLGNWGEETQLHLNFMWMPPFSSLSVSTPEVFQAPLSCVSSLVHIPALQHAASCVDWGPKTEKGGNRCAVETVVQALAHCTLEPPFICLLVGGDADWPILGNHLVCWGWEWSHFKMSTANVMMQKSLFLYFVQGNVLSTFVFKFLQ